MLCIFPIDSDGCIICPHTTQSYSGMFLIYSVFRFAEFNYWSVHWLLILTLPLLNAAVSGRNYGSTVHFRLEHQIYDAEIYEATYFPPNLFLQRWCWNFQVIHSFVMDYMLKVFDLLDVLKVPISASNRFFDNVSLFSNFWQLWLQTSWFEWTSYVEVEPTIQLKIYTNVETVIVYYVA